MSLASGDVSAIRWLQIDVAAWSDADAWRARRAEGGGHAHDATPGAAA